MCHVLKQQKITVLFDSAYQGFASGDFDRDSFAVRYFLDQEMPLIVAQSYAKNFGLYGMFISFFTQFKINKQTKPPLLHKTIFNIWWFLFCNRTSCGSCSFCM